MASGNNLQAFPASFVASVRDDTGITITVAAAGTSLPLKGALFEQRLNALPGASGFAWVAADGTLTIGKNVAGIYDIEVVGGWVVGTNAGVKIVGPAKNGTILAKSRAVEPGTAVGASQSVIAPAVSLAAGDVVTVECDAGTNGHVVIARDLALKLTRVR
jgi:hypothetical protein